MYYQKRWFKFVRNNDNDDDGDDNATKLEWTCGLQYRMETCSHMRLYKIALTLNNRTHAQHSIGNLRCPPSA